MKKYTLPIPSVDQKETDSIQYLTERYIKLCEPKPVVKLGKKLGKIVPTQIKNAFSDLGDTISQQELYKRIMEYIGTGFKDIQEIAAKYTLRRNSIIQKVNSIVPENDITDPAEFCLARSYDIATHVSKFKDSGMISGLIEGAVTGAFGFAGLIPNLVFCTFMCFRAVQTVATFYGYDVKNNPSEMAIASEVFANALSPATAQSDELGDVVFKIMAFGEVAALKDAVAKPYAKMAAEGGLAKLLVQLRALANGAARKGLEQAGQKGLEENMFKNVLKQIGKGLDKKTVGKMIPGLGAIIGAAFDLAQMKTVITFADIFYQKRFLLEKEHNIDLLIGPPHDVIDV